jgi:hypothetical protein
MLKPNDARICARCRDGDADAIRDIYRARRETHRAGSQLGRVRADEPFVALDSVAN